MNNEETLMPVNAGDVYSRINRLISLPPVRIKPEAMKEYLSYFNDSCPGSKRIVDEARQYIPGGVQHNLAFNHPFPLLVDRSEGAYLYDRDGHRYIDLLQAGGPTILGGNDANVRRQVTEVLEQTGPSTGLFNEFELLLAKEISSLVPSVEMFRMLGSGT